MTKVYRMKKLDPSKVFTQYRDVITPSEPIRMRKYTITHSDLSAELFVFIAGKYAEDQITQMRDEVRLSWKKGEKGFILLGNVIIDGEGVSGDPQIRNNIFIREMPTALQALRQGDRFLFSRYPCLDKSPVYIRFNSSIPAYSKTYQYGVIGDYK